MKIILIKTDTSPEYIEIVKENDLNLVFESYNEIDDWIYENGLNMQNFTPIEIEKNNFDLNSIIKRNTHKLNNS